MSPREQLDAIRDRARRSSSARRRSSRESPPALHGRRIQITDWDDLKKDTRGAAAGLRGTGLPGLTPLSVDPAHPFPYISDLSLNLAVVVRDPETGARRFARVKMPSPAAPLLEGPGHAPVRPARAGDRRTPRSALPGMKIVERAPVPRHAGRRRRGRGRRGRRPARDARVAAPRPAALAARPFGWRSTPSMPQELRTTLLRELGLTASDLYVIDGLLDLGDLWSLTELDRPARRSSRGPASRRRCSRPRRRAARHLRGRFASVDVLVHHPYDSVRDVGRGVRRPGGRRSHVLAIKQTIYRTSGEGEAPIVRSLMRAAERRARRPSPSSSSPRAATRRRTSPGRGRSRRRASTSSTGSSG